SPGQLMLENLVLMNGLIEGIDGGGSLAVGVGSTLSMLDCLLLNNHAERSYGGAVFIAGNSTGIFQRVSFQSNQALLRGGALYVQGSAVVKEGCRFLNNTARLLGDHIFLEERATLALSSELVDTVTLNDNTTVARIQREDVNTTRVTTYIAPPPPFPEPAKERIVETLEELRAAIADQALLDGQLRLQRSVDLDSRALPTVMWGLAILGECGSQRCVLDAHRQSQILQVGADERTQGVLVLEHIELRNGYSYSPEQFNSQAWGAALHFGENATGIITNCTFVSNYAGGLFGMGGALSTTKGSHVSLANTVFDSNRSNKLGGAIATEGGLLELRDGCLFVNNTSHDQTSRPPAIVGYLSAKPSASLNHWIYLLPSRIS
ncbi:hypothetical protein CYMTET_22975, partial [Cymbomonas tetramitiformis]